MESNEIIPSARPNFERDIDWMVKLAQKNICNGIIEEPRVFYDTFQLLADGLVSEGQRGVFINGEQFPIRITHLSSAIRPNFQQQSGLDERQIQRMGLRLTFHDQYYQARQFVPVPLWSNKVVAGPAPTTTAFVSKVFDRPTILSARDSLRVTVALEATPTPGTSRPVNVTVTGVGLESGRPYFFASGVSLVDTVPRVLNTADFRNDGTEPIALTDMVYSCGSEDTDAVGAGDIRFLRVQVRQIGNGTQADWFIGPTSPVLAECPASLLGITEGRAIVHRFPGDGLIWEPGEGIIVQGAALSPTSEGLNLAVAMHGYISLV